MVTAEKTNRNHHKQKGLLALLSTMIAGLLLAVPAIAQAEDGEPLHGFLDVGFSTNSKDSNNPSLPDLPRGFNVGSLDFYLTPHLGNVKGLIEIIFETTSSGEVATDLERAEIGYTFSDAATLWAGRFHTPYGYWNTAFHHGSQMQTSVTRPRFLDFEDKGGILPAHMVGMLVSGKTGAGDGKLTYDAYAGNGPAIAIDGTAPPPGGVLDIQTAGDNNHQSMFGFNLGYEFSGMADGLRLAVHGLRGDVQDDAVPSFNITELSMGGVSVAYLENDWEVVGEYYRFSNTDKNSTGNTGSHSSWADYLQVGKSFNSVTPFLRVEKTVLNQADNYFAMQDNGQSYFRQALGLKYDLNQLTALKFELQNSDFSAEAGRTPYKYHSFLAQLAIRF